MKAGRELDALVAEKVMGAKVVFVENVPYYSTDIAAAWEVMENLVSTPGPNGDHHSVQVDYSGDVVVVIDENEDWRVSAIAGTVPLAICLAALRAKGVTHE
jgi:hypothetical protein